jgi:protein phosphatase
LKISLPDFSLVVMVGATGSGKSQFARKHFLETEIVSSDRCRALVSDDETNQAATADAFALVHAMAALRLKRRKLTVIDATSVRPEDRRTLVRLAREWHALPVAIVLNIDADICNERNASRPNRDFGPHVARNHVRALRHGLRGLRKEGFLHTFVFNSSDDADAATIERAPLWTDKRHLQGPFDIIGDVHGCFDELTELLGKLGYDIDVFETGAETPIAARHPEGRTALFVGDLCDRGPRNVDVLRLAMGMVAAGTGACVIGNHDFKLLKWLNGKSVQLNHGLDLTVAELEARSAEFRAELRKFVDGLLSHHWLDGGKLVVAHAGLKAEMHGRGSGAVRQFAMFGDTTGEIDEFGLPVRLDWAKGYRSEATVVYGHTPIREAQWLNGTICIDTGCVFGGALTALRWPERELVSVPARRQYAVPKKPLDSEGTLSLQQQHDQLLFFDDFLGRRRIETRLARTILVPEEQTVAALEVKSRFAVDPRWLIHLPPTMAPPPTAPSGPFLERPEEALDYYAKNGVEQVVAEEKHMGSRALLVIARDAEAARKRFGVEDGRSGTIFTRTGRPFFKEKRIEETLIGHLIAAVERAGLFEELNSDWLLLDAEVMPWSAKAQDLLRKQYDPTVNAAIVSSKALLAAIEAAGGAVDGLDALRERSHARLKNAELMRQTIAGYCWDVNDFTAYRIAPFHLLAVEGQTFSSKTHAWHMETLARIAGGDPVIRATKWHQLSPASEDDRRRLQDWWLDHTASGGEGLVIKPLDFIARGPKGLIQPAMKVRGRDYLRIIYGPDYDLPENIERLRKRGLGRKWSLAEKEFALGLEALERFVAHRPLAEVHECVLGVLALESEPVDPRL